VPFEAIGAADKRRKRVVRHGGWMRNATRMADHDNPVFRKKNYVVTFKISQSENSASLRNSMENKSTLYIL
jgi:hypothetical protein